MFLFPLCQKRASTVFPRTRFSAARRYSNRKKFCGVDGVSSFLLKSRSDIFLTLESRSGVCHPYNVSCIFHFCPTAFHSKIFVSLAQIINVFFLVFTASVVLYIAGLA